MHERATLFGRLLTRPAGPSEWDQATNWVSAE